MIVGSLDGIFVTEPLVFHGVPNSWSEVDRNQYSFHFLAHRKIATMFRPFHWNRRELRNYDWFSSGWPKSVNFDLREIFAPTKISGYFCVETHRIDPCSKVCLTFSPNPIPNKVLKTHFFPGEYCMSRLLKQTETRNIKGQI